MENLPALRLRERHELARRHTTGLEALRRKTIQAIVGGLVTWSVLWLYNVDDPLPPSLAAAFAMGVFLSTYCRQTAVCGWKCAHANQNAT